MISKEALNSYLKVVESQLIRIEKMKEESDFIDYRSLDKIIIGVCGGDGIEPVITAQTKKLN